VDAAAEIMLDIARVTRVAVAEFEFKHNQGDAETLFASMEKVLADLAGERPSSARLLCAEVAAVAWVEWWLLSLMAASSKFQTQTPEQNRRRTAAHRRFMMSLKTLSQIAAAERKPRRMIDVDFTEVFGPV
jgi:hypothetical protein